MWPSADLGFALFSGDGGLKSVGVNIGTWNSLHTGDAGLNNLVNGKLWYESDFYATLGFGLSGGTTVGVTYTAYTSPNGLFGTVKEIAFKLAVDDSGYLGGAAVQPVRADRPRAQRSGRRRSRRRNLRRARGRARRYGVAGQRVGAGEGRPQRRRLLRRAGRRRDVRLLQRRRESRRCRSRACRRGSARGTCTAAWNTSVLAIATRSHSARTR